MKILVIGGTRYFGIHMVNKLLEQGHAVTIATRGKTPDSYGDKVERITFKGQMKKVCERHYKESILM